MSTSKHIDKICIALIAIVLVLTLVIMTLYSRISSVSDNTGKEMGYENRLFDTSRVHTIDIVMNDWDSFISNCENEEYSSCTAVIDGEKYSNIGIRGKGNTSLSNVSEMDSQRYSFKIEFDHYEEGRSYYGLDKLCLNNLIQDNTMMKDYLVYQMMNEFGVDTPLSSYVYITVNGQDWGLYLAVEGIEDSFLTRNYGSNTGEMYKPDSMSFGAGRGNGKDFDMEEFEQKNDNNSDSQSDEKETDTEMNQETETETGQKGPGNFDFGKMQPPGDFNPEDMPEQFGDFDFSAFDGEAGNLFGGDNPIKGGGFGGMGSSDVKLKYSDDNFESYTNIFNNAKTEITKADKERLIAALKNLSEYNDLENTLDMEEVLRYFVVHNFVCNGDSYTGSMIHNYYLHESDGQLSMIPWDYNLAFGTFTGGDASGTVNTSIDEPVSGGDINDRPMVGWIFSDSEYTEKYHELFAEFLEEWYDSGKLEKMITDTYEMIKPYVEKDPTKFCTTEEFEAGVEAISQFVSYRLEAVARQLSGDDTAVDTGDLNLSDMGTMNTGGGPAGFGGGRAGESDDFGGGPQGDFAGFGGGPGGDFSPPDKNSN